MTPKSYGNGASTDAASQRTHLSCGSLCEFVAGSRTQHLRSQIVPMMQSTQPRYRNHLATANTAGHCVTSRRSLLIQTEVSPVVMVVANILSHEALEMPLIEHNDVIEQVSAAVADEGGWPTHTFPILP